MIYSDKPIMLPLSLTDTVTLPYFPGYNYGAVDAKTDFEVKGLICSEVKLIFKGRYCFNVL